MKTGITSFIVKQYGMDAGASVIGIAAASDFGLAPEGFKPSNVLESCRSVIVLGAPHPREALSNTEEYTGARNAMLTNMTDIAKKVAKRIGRDGHQAKAISASGGKTIDGKHCGPISLKHAAELAGLGVIGKNYLLANRQYGNLLWLSAVLTDVELTPDEIAESTMCDNCNKCAQACPAGALNDLASFGRKGCLNFL